MCLVRHWRPPVLSSGAAAAHLAHDAYDPYHTCMTRRHPQAHPSGETAWSKRAALVQPHPGGETNATKNTKAI
eukprot:1821027-Amphidinium_carterae.2